MPSRNVQKIYLTDSYYHIYNRGVNKRRIFTDREDYAVFLNLLKRYLGDSPVYDKQGRKYPWLNKESELLAFCLMPNHFHLLFFQKTDSAMKTLLHGLSTSYTMYFNKKHERVGPLFQESYRASLIYNDAYLEHISRYIHLNPKAYAKWEFSSLPYYLNQKKAIWIKPDRIMSIFNNSPAKYQKFVEDYEDHKKMLDEIKGDLAY